MPAARRDFVTQLLLDLGTDPEQPEAGTQLWDVLYEELKSIARRMARAERKPSTLQPTEIVHEAFLRLIHQDRTSWQNRAHFYSIAAQVMRRVLVDRARARTAARRGGHAQRVTLPSEIQGEVEPMIETIALDQALTQLRALHERMSRVVELRVFAGLPLDEVAEVLGVSRRTVHSDWVAARQWISRELRKESN